LREGEDFANSQGESIALNQKIFKLFVSEITKKAIKSDENEKFLKISVKTLNIFIVL